MAVKDWKNRPNRSTPLSAEALEDLEARVKGVYIQEDAPSEGDEPWLWLPIDGDGVWDGTFHVYSPVPPTPPATAPDPPTGLDATAGDGEVVLTWFPPADDGGSAITDYLVEKSLAGAGTWTTFAEGVSTSAGATVTGLSNGTEYDFRVSAINAVGTGSPSDTASATPEAFDPGSLSPAAWFKPESLSALSDSDPVATWPDSSGNGRDLVQATALNKPLYKTNIQNGLAVVRFDGVGIDPGGDNMEFDGGSNWVTGTELTVYIVSLKRATVGQSNAAQMVLYASKGGTDYGSATNAVLGDIGAAATGLQTYRAGVLSEHAAGEGLDAAHVVTYLFDGVNNTLFFDGAAETPVASTASFGSRYMLIGARWTGSLSNWGQRDYGEILVFLGAHDTDEREAVEAYLKDKWGTP